MNIYILRSMLGVLCRLIEHRAKEKVAKRNIPLPLPLPMPLVRGSLGASLFLDNELIK